MISSISILGSTGSIGTQALEVCKELDIQISSLSCGHNMSRLKEQIIACRPRLVSVAKQEDAQDLSTWLNELSAVDLPRKPEVLYGAEGNRAVAGDPDSEMVLAAMVGMAGLDPVIHALKTGHHIALANKETLVAGGDLVMQIAGEMKREIRPVDSEHSAIWQCLQGSAGGTETVKKILLTASGGPFRGKSAEDLIQVTREEALNHPTWSMGGKITIDSATLMNKGLELIEAMHLFSLPQEKIEVVVHPESIIHSAVAYHDGAVLAQLSYPDMKLPIRLALTWPDRSHAELPYWNPLSDGGTILRFEEPDRVTFRCLALAETAASRRGDSPVILNSSNEIAVEAFLRGELRFLDIAQIVEETLNRLAGRETGLLLDLEQIESIDLEARAVAKQLISAL